MDNQEFIEILLNDGLDDSTIIDFVETKNNELIDLRAKLAAMESQEVPADKSAVAVPDDHMHVSEFVDLCKSFSSRTGSIYIGDVEGALSGYLSAALNASAPSHSQQSAATDAERFCDAHCTWLDHHPDCPRHESEGDK